MKIRFTAPGNEQHEVLVFGSTVMYLGRNTSSSSLNSANRENTLKN